MKIYENTKFQEYTGHKNHRNVTFSEKKAPAAVHHTHTGHKNTRNVMFSKKTPYIYICIYIEREI